MTPLAAKLWRGASYENQAKKVVTGSPEILPRLIAPAQFFECSAIWELAMHAYFSEHDDGYINNLHFSQMAQLPSEPCGLEFYVKTNGKRVFVLLIRMEEDEDFINWIKFVEFKGQITLTEAGGFGPGTNLWKSTLPAEEENFAICGNMLIEKLLCIINQPNIVRRIERQTDKRIVRAMRHSADKFVNPVWHELRIMGGKEISGAPSQSRDLSMPLHYVRKYFKPSQQIWIDGYWRGNADLGVHLKTYFPQPPTAFALGDAA